MRLTALFLVLMLSPLLVWAEETGKLEPTPEQAAICTRHQGVAIEKNGAIVCDLPWVNSEADGRVTIGKIPNSFITQKGHLYYENGMVCKGCRLIVSKDMSFSIVVDQQGYQWPVKGLRAIDKHPFMRVYAQAAANAGQQYGYQMQQNAQRQLQMIQQNRPVNVNCSSYRAGYTTQTNCTSY